MANCGAIWGSAPTSPIARRASDGLDERTREPAPSESHLFVDVCLARVREAAGLDDGPVLTPLHVALEKEAPQRLVLERSARQLPTAEAIVRSAAEPSAIATRTRGGPRNAPTFLMRTRPKTFTEHLSLRWPVLACGFVAGIFGGMAMMKSPLGQKPAVQHVVRGAQAQAANVYSVAIAAAKSRLVQR